MKAVTIGSYGDSSVLHLVEDLPRPIPQPHQILVNIKSSSINPIDVMKRQGYGKTIFEKQRKNTFPWILGSDFSGVVAGVGNKVTRIKEGDKVWGCTSSPNSGTYCDYSIFNQEEVSFKPKNLSFSEAATIPYAALTTWSGIVRWAGLRPLDLKDKRVLIKAASGGVGTIAVQLLKHWGAFISTTSSEKNKDLLSNLGADNTINYQKECFSKLLTDYDLVYDCLGYFGGDEEVKKTISILNKISTSNYITLNHPFIKEIDSKGLLRGLPSALMKRQNMKRLYSPIGVHWSLYRPSLSGLEEIGRLVNEGIIKPVIDSSIELDEIQKGHIRMESSRTVGKISLNIND